MREVTCVLPQHMTEDELREWGRKEMVMRDANIADDVSTAAALATARRNAANLSMSQAFAAVVWAQRERREAHTPTSRQEAAQGGMER